VEIPSITIVIQAFGVSLAYLVATAGLMKSGSKIKDTTYWILMFLITLVGIMARSVLYTNIVVVILASLYISKSYGALKRFSFAVTIFAVFQWTIAFVGSGTFILNHYRQVMGSTGLMILLVSTLLVASLLLMKYKDFVFKDTINRLFVIDTAAKLFFVTFFNAFLPRFFPLLGGVSYSILVLVLLGVTLLFIAYREYSVSLERQLAAEYIKLQSVLEWADRTISKYMVIEFPEFNHINHIGNSVLKALLFEFIDTAHRQGITVDIAIESHVGDIRLDTYDLFSIINDFMLRSLEEATAQDDKQIRVVIDGSDGFHFLTKTNISKNEVIPDFEARKQAIISLIKKYRDTSVLVNISREQQMLSVV